MTRKDYGLIAAAIAGERDAKLTYAEGERRIHAIDAIDDVTANIAHALAADNPRFDRAGFLAACGCPQ